MGVCVFVCVSGPAHLRRGRPLGPPHPRPNPRGVRVSAPARAHEREREVDGGRVREGGGGRERKMASREGNLGFCAFTHHNVKRLSLQSFPPPPSLSRSHSRSLALSLSRSLSPRRSRCIRCVQYPLSVTTFVIRCIMRYPSRYPLSVTISVIRDNIRYP